MRRQRAATPGVANVFAVFVMCLRLGDVEPQLQGKGRLPGHLGPVFLPVCKWPNGAGQTTACPQRVPPFVAAVAKRWLHRRAEAGINGAWAGGEQPQPT